MLRRRRTICLEARASCLKKNVTSKYWGSTHLALLSCLWGNFLPMTVCLHLHLTQIDPDILLVVLPLGKLDSNNVRQPLCTAHLWSPHCPHLCEGWLWADFTAKLSYLRRYPHQLPRENLREWRLMGLIPLFGHLVLFFTCLPAVCKQVLSFRKMFTTRFGKVKLSCTKFYVS